MITDDLTTLALRKRIRELEAENTLLRARLGLDKPYLFPSAWAVVPLQRLEELEKANS